MDPPALVIMNIPWVVANSWYTLIEYEEWKVISDEKIIIKKQIHRNSTHLSMPGDATFVRGRLEKEVGLDGEGKSTE